MAYRKNANDLLKYVYTQLSNMHCGVPTDCPHREKLPYTGDGHLTAESAMYCLSAEAFFSKWLSDILASQYTNGYVPHTAPDAGAGGGRFWGYAVVELPSVLYRMTGDKEYIRRAYPAVLRWLNYFENRSEGFLPVPDGRRWALGDWLAPEPMRASALFFDAVCYFASVAAAAEFYRILYGKRDKKREELGERIRAAINATYYRKEGKFYANDEQGETALALYFGVPDKSEQEAVAKHVRDKYEKDCRFDTGILATPMLLECLSRYGYADTAYRLLTAQGYPSYAYMLKGETTFPEHWSKKWIAYKFSDTDEKTVEGGGDLSHCHPMFGSVVAWLYKHVAGLNVSELFGGKTIFAPLVTQYVRIASAHVQTVFGKASFAYDATAAFAARATVPHGVRGEFRLPAGRYAATEERTGEKKFFPTERFCLPSGQWYITIVEG